MFCACCGVISLRACVVCVPLCCLYLKLAWFVCLSELSLYLCDYVLSVCICDHFVPLYACVLGLYECVQFVPLRFLCTQRIQSIILHVYVYEDPDSHVRCGPEMNVYFGSWLCIIYWDYSTFLYRWTTI